MECQKDENEILNVLFNIYIPAVDLIMSDIQTINETRFNMQSIDRFDFKGETKGFKELFANNKNLDPGIYQRCFSIILNDNSCFEFIANTQTDKIEFFNHLKTYIFHKLVQCKATNTKYIQSCFRQL